MYFCKNQIDTKDCGIQCIAHLAEGRVLICPYKSKEDVKTNKRMCHDFEEIDTKEN